MSLINEYDMCVVKSVVASIQASREVEKYINSSPDQRQVMVIEHLHLIVQRSKVIANLYYNDDKFREDMKARILAILK